MNGCGWYKFSSNNRILACRGAAFKTSMCPVHTFCIS